MQLAKNGAALIGDVVVPAAEVKVFIALKKMARPATVPELAKAMKEEFSDASLYSLLKRLHEKRRLVNRQVVEIEVAGTKLRRINWDAHPSDQSDGILFSTKDGANYEDRPERKSRKGPTATAAVPISMDQIGCRT